MNKQEELNSLLVKYEKLVSQGKQECEDNFSDYAMSNYNHNCMMLNSIKKKLGAIVD